MLITIKRLCYMWVALMENIGRLLVVVAGVLGMWLGVTLFLSIVGAPLGIPLFVLSFLLFARGLWR